MTYINNLFLTEKTEKKIEKIKENIADGKFISPICLIVISQNDADVFDIIPLINLKNKSYRGLYEDMHVLGIAESKKAAISLCVNMTEQYFNKKSPLSMRDYFKAFTI